MKPILCKDCKYLVTMRGKRTLANPHCRHPNALLFEDLVNGEDEYEDAALVRSDESKCGRDAVWFRADTP